MGKRLESVEEFYRDGEILLTGGTGFLGKLVIVKLLRSFPGIRKIYMMVRDKKGASAEERLNALFRNVIFERLHLEVPDFKSKIHVLPCNLELRDLGLSPENKQMLISRVNIVLHGAATLRFDEDLQVAIQTNVRGTREVLNLAKQCPNLKMLTYVSTAFSHARSQIGEVVYEPKTHYKELLELSMLCPDDPRLPLMKAKLALESVNTYTLTKAASEHLISEEAKTYPVTIFRPSIVISTWSDPIAGYIDNLYGPTGLVTGVQAGIIRCISNARHIKADMVPADYVVNALICCTWDGYNKFQADNSCLPVYNYVSSTTNPITWSEFETKGYQATVRYPYSRMLYSPFVYNSPNPVVYALRTLIVHYLVGYLLIPMYRKMDKVIHLLRPFSTTDWIFDSANILHTWNQLGPTDRAKFPFNIADLDWDEYLDRYVRGTLVHHLQDSMETTVRKKAMERANRLYLLHQFLKALFYGIFMITLWSFLQPYITIQR
ncbi:hypothetical protein M8J76_003104 [Diaphorina citri]|nr:hypothetical protein M8J76_003104 [Diaphorina citri]